jgi:hypothetical protein
MAIKAVIIGFSHMHVNEIALYIDEAEGIELCAAADVPSKAETISPKRYTPAWNLQNVRENYCPDIYEDYRQMLDENIEIMAIIDAAVKSSKSGKEEKICD